MLCFILVLLSIFLLGKNPRASGKLDPIFLEMSLTLITDDADGEEATESNPGAGGKYRVVLGYLPKSCPQRRQLQVLRPGNSERGLIWKRGLWGCNYGKMSHTEQGWTLNPIASILNREEREPPLKMEVEAGVTWPLPRNTRGTGHWKRQEGSSLRDV